MDTGRAKLLKPRKMPVQSRANVTVQAIFEGSIQVLQREGYSRLTTTRVAERAGVSVGTLYQYFPNKQALLAAVLENHLAQVATAIELACHSQHGHTVREMVTAAFNAYIDIELARLDATHVLNLLPIAEIGGDVLIHATSSRVQQALIAMLQTARDARFGESIELEITSLVLATAPIGAMQRMLMQRAGPEPLNALRRHFIELGVSYLRQVMITTPD